MWQNNFWTNLVHLLLSSDSRDRSPHAHCLQWIWTHRGTVPIDVPITCTYLYDVPGGTYCWPIINSELLRPKKGWLFGTEWQNSELLIQLSRHFGTAESRKMNRTVNSSELHDGVSLCTILAFLDRNRIILNAHWTRFGSFTCVTPLFFIHLFQFNRHIADHLDWFFLFNPFEVRLLIVLIHFNINFFNRGRSTSGTPPFI